MRKAYRRLTVLLLAALLVTPALAQWPDDGVFVPVIDLEWYCTEAGDNYVPNGFVSLTDPAGWLAAEVKEDGSLVLRRTEACNEQCLWPWLRTRDVNEPTKVDLAMTPYLYYEFEAVDCEWMLMLELDDFPIKLAKEICGGRLESVNEDGPAGVYKGRVDVRAVWTQIMENVISYPPRPDDYVVELNVDLDGMSFFIVDRTPERRGRIMVNALYFGADENAPGAKPFTPDLQNPVSGWARPDVIEAVELSLAPQTVLDNCVFKEPISRMFFCYLAVSFIEAVSGMDIEAFIHHNDSAQDVSFPDCDDGAVMAVARLGIVEGIAGGLMEPNRGIRRDEAAIVLTKLCAVLGVDDAGSPQTAYADQADIHRWAREEINFMQAIGVMTGTTNNRFAPESMYTAETAIVTILRLYETLYACGADKIDAELNDNVKFCQNSFIFPPLLLQWLR